MQRARGDPIDQRHPNEHHRIPARWRAEVTYEDASYNEFDIDDDASLRHLLRQLT